MKKQILILIVLSGLLNFSCDNGNSNGNESIRAEYVCNCKQIEKVSEFIQTSIKNANNMSDEEMEDVIQELHRTAVKVNCQKKNIKAKRSEFGNITQLTQELDSCDKIMENIY
ncbi:MAG: hypothetical protein IPJ01_10425 [Micavibrio sp.]|nr:hypothetical protein [Micavibrio sp.]